VIFLIIVAAHRRDTESTEKAQRFTEMISLAFSVYLRTLCVTLCPSLRLRPQREADLRP